MKKRIPLFLMMVFVITFAACGNKKGQDYLDASVLEAMETVETEVQSEVQQFLADEYGMRFKLWGPEGQDLYAFHVYPDHAERECHILMPANTDDISEYQKNLSWEVVDNELVITGEWQETFEIDISMETATSATTGRVYQIYEMEPPVE